MLTDGAKEQYRRQLALIGEAGQERLLRASVLVAGAGGLGTAIALQCAFAGIGRIRIVDGDVIERTNLNRQILYREGDIGRYKADAAALRLEGIHPDLRVEAVHTGITEKNVDAFVQGCDIVLDGMDNYPARYLLDAAARAARVPFVHGAVHGFYGQVSTFIAGITPCLRCLVPYPPPDGAVPILGVTAGAIGCIQATEAIKYLVGTGSLLTSRVLLWDGLGGDAVVEAVEGNPGCPVCGGTAGAGR